MAGAAREIATPRPNGKHEFPLSDAQFQRLRTLVHRHAGIALADSKRELVYGRLVRRLRTLALPGFAAYIARLEADDATEVEEFINAITTNFTGFFREDHHFRHLADSVLPRIAARNAGQRLRIWSAGCSSGEEAYSIAMILAEAAPLLSDIDVRVLATDLDSNVLAQARTGLYDHARVAKLAASRRERFFEPADAGRWRVREALRAGITFNPLNLMHAWPMRGPFDVIFCRNVVIYFDPATQRDVFRRMADLQRPGDLLFIGHSETLFRVCDQYELLGQTIYRRRGP